MINSTNTTQRQEGQSRKEKSFNVATKTMESLKIVAKSSADSKRGSREASPIRKLHTDSKESSLPFCESPTRRYLNEQSREKETSVVSHDSSLFNDDVKGSEECAAVPTQSDDNDGNFTTISQLSNESTGDIKPFYKTHHRTSSSLAYNRIATKIACTKESIKREQTARDANVNEYLKLAASADKQQLQRIKTVFEKKNQKSAHNISQLQKKLESYSKRYKDLQYHQDRKQAQNLRQPREVLRDVGQGLRNVGGNIRDGVSGLSATVMSKPREFAHLIKNKFGSADNINQLSSTWYTDNNAPDLNNVFDSGRIEDNVSLRYDNLINPKVGLSESQEPADLLTIQKPGVDMGEKYAEHDSECSSVTSDSIPLSSDKHRMLRRNRHSTNYVVHSLRDDFDRVIEKLQKYEILSKDIAELAISLDTERYRAERLEEQLNDLTELHQNEIENLKQAIADLEEKVQYQSDERLRDVYDIMENCQTRITKIEHTSQQQYVTVDGIENSNARAVVVKLINVVLTVLQVLLLIMAAAAGITMPFFKTRLRTMSTVFFILLIALIVKQWFELQKFWLYVLKDL